MSRNSSELIGIAYVSQAKASFEDRDIEALSERAAHHNQMHGITGYLHFAKGRFFQYIEGPPAAMSELMEAIEADERHRVEQKIKQALENGRRFPGWGMRSLKNEPPQGIFIEDVLQQQFQYLSIGHGGEARWRTLLWRSIDSLATLRNKLDRDRGSTPKPA